MQGLLGQNTGPSLMDASVAKMGAQHWDCVVVPSLFALQCVRRRWIDCHGQGILPKMVTYDHPLGYTLSSLIGQSPVSLGQGLAWTLHFFQNHRTRKAGLPVDLAGFARSLLNLWEHIEYQVLYVQSHEDTFSLGGRDGFSLPDALLGGIYASGTPHMVQAWLKWWPQWLHRHKVCSQTRATFFAQEHALALWQRNPRMAILLVVQKGEKTPVKWLEKVMALPGTMTICQEAIASVSQGVESLNPKFLDASLNYNNPTSGSRLGPILDSTNGSTSGSIEGGGVGLSDLSSISLGEGSAERAFDEQGASGQRKQSLVCSTPGEQARVMALLVRQGLQDPHAWVGLVVPCNTLLAQVNHVLRRYNIPIAVSKIGLITTLLHAIWRAAAASWGLAELGALMRHPLVLKTYPIAEPMAQWIQLYSPEWPPTNGAGGGNPRWFRRLHAFVWKAGGELAQVIANSAHNGTAHCLIFWIDAHLKTLHALVPVSEWDSTLVVEKMLQERLGALPQLDGSAYGHWMLSWTLSVGQVADSGHPRVVCGNREDMSFVQPHRCIMAFSAQCQPFPWMPKSWSDYFAIPPLENAMALPELGQNGEIWVLRHHPTPTESCYQKWAPRILAHGPWIHHDRLVKGGDGLMKNPSLIRPYPPLTVLSISDLQRWKSDPEAFYQERVLKIKSSIISPQQIWGMAIHTLLHHFVQDFPVQNHYTPDQLHHGLRLLAGIFLPPMPWWKQPRINALLHEIAQMEYEQRQKGIQESVTEQSGKWTFSLPQGTVTLVARADRIDYLHDGTAHIIDYKTGAIPSFVSLERMESIQLPLEGLMVQQGAFGIARPVSKISWWSVHATRGSQMKTYPRCVEKLLAPYGILLPKWLNQALAGGYAEPMEII